MQPWNAGRFRYLRTRKPLKTIQRDPAQPWTVRYPCRLPFLRAKAPLRVGRAVGSGGPIPSPPGSCSRARAGMKRLCVVGPQVADPSAGWEQMAGVSGQRAPNHTDGHLGGCAPLVQRYGGRVIRCAHHAVIARRRRHKRRRRRDFGGVEGSATLAGCASTAWHPVRLQRCHKTLERCSRNARDCPALRRKALQGSQ